MDFNYRTVDTQKILDAMELPELQQSYVWDYFDCEDMAWILKAIIHKEQINGIGFIFGFYGSRKTFHCWNVYVDEDGAHQVDPMIKRIFDTSPSHRPVCIIM